MSRTTISLATGAAACLLAALPLSANAATGMTDSDSATAVAAAAPAACVSASYSNPSGPYQDVTVKNGCPTSQRVKVIWAYATDSACHVISPGKSYTDHHLNQNGIDRWDGIKSC